MALIATIDQASPAHADVPGDCLVIDNETGSTQTLTMTDPYHSGQWEISPGDRVILEEDGIPVISSDGHWSVTSRPYYDGTWSYDADANTDRGCNGSEILTWYS